ncbi:hypothetical protein DYB32_007175 [Aphanomyces invadans]|uniref:DNA replication ATP-dependent helicase/nuclease n=1 Tax=Aphanomyces invadans TaxID=157072 RepID=A0A3R7A6W0_9STRA|nr:hypothetical protein DYB32_007175 [Aphanomyces invadans]
MDTSDDRECENDGSIGKDGSLEVIWKDSPMEKKLQANGTSNRHANLSELRGFVHSLISSPSPNKNPPKAKASALLGEVSSGIDSNAAVVKNNIARFIVFSPDRATTTGHHDAMAAGATTGSSAAKTPPIHRNKRRKTGEEHEDLLSVLEKLDEEYSDTPEKGTTGATTTTGSFDDEAFESPFSKEAWEVIEQIEIKATQQSMQKRQDSAPQAALPVQTISPVGDTLKPQPPPPAVAQQLSAHRAPIVVTPPVATPTTSTPIDYLRCVALEVRVDGRQKAIRALDDATEATITIVLRDDWFDTPLQVGDTFHFILTMPVVGPPPTPLVADNRAHRIILHPDILVSPTTVTASMSCSRRAVLQQTLTMQRNAGPVGLIGTLKHELFQKALAARTYAIPFLIEQSQEVIKSNLLKLLEYGVTTQQAADELKASYQCMYKWLNQVHKSGIRVTSGPPLYRLHHVLSIEEPLWSLKYGLKGAVDACLAMQPFDGRRADATTQMMAFELKTGKPSHSTEHVGQVLLYTLLLDERYQGTVSQRMASMTWEQPVEAHIRGLLHSRNVHAAHLFQAQSRQLMPPLLKKTWDCENCFVATECMVHHAAIEQGSAVSSGVSDVFEKAAGHLTARELAYFKKWIQLLEWEGRCNRHPLWLRPTGADDGPSTAAASFLTKLNAQLHTPDVLELIVGDVAGNFLLADLKVQDRVVVSVNSGPFSIFHVAKAAVAVVQPTCLRLALFSPIPSMIVEGHSVVGSSFHYRVDKDTTYSGLEAAKRNVLSLMVHPDMEPKRKLICHLHPPRFEAVSVEARLRRRCLEPGGCRAACERLLQEFYSTMNSDQQRAIGQVRSILNAKDYALVLGMPGTGKTTAIAMAVRVLMYLGLSVLVTSYTHAAVDNILVKLLDQNVPILRVGGTPALVHPQVVPHRLESTAFESAEAMRAAMVAAPIVGCTCLTSHHVIFAQRKFDVCIVDEASQITQPVLLGVLQHAAVFCLVGDHYQLGGLDWSLFKCLSEAHPQASTVLGFQYRMNHQIMLVANRLIYNNQLKLGRRNAACSDAVHGDDLPTGPPPVHGTGAASKIPAWIAQVLDARRGVVFLNTDRIAAGAAPAHARSTGQSMMGLEAREGSSRGLVNSTEARLIMGLADMMPRADDIAILSPFRSQVNYLKQVLVRHEVSTIDTYQGKDRRIVFVSFVRSNGDGIVGDLLLDWRRINVALTRAKDKLVLVGSLTTLRASPVLHALLDLVDQENWRIDVPPDYTATFPPLPSVATSSQTARRRAGEVRSYVVQPATTDIENLVGGIVRASKHPPRPMSHRVHVSRNILDE